MSKKQPSGRGARKPQSTEEFSAEISRLIKKGLEEDAAEHERGLPKNHKPGEGIDWVEPNDDALED